MAATSNTAPTFTREANVTFAALTTANTNTDGSSSVVNLTTGGTNGSLLLALRVQAQVTTTSGIIRIYLYDGSSASSLIFEFDVPAVTLGSSSPGYSAVWVPEHRFIIPQNYILRAAPTKSEAFALTAFAGDY